MIIYAIHLYFLLLFLIIQIYSFLSIEKSEFHSKLAKWIPAAT